MVRKLSGVALILATALWLSPPLQAAPADNGTVIIQGGAPATSSDSGVIVDDSNKAPDRSARPQSGDETFVIRPDGSIDQAATTRLRQQEAGNPQPEPEIIVFPDVVTRPDPNAVTSSSNSNFPPIPVIIYKRVKNIVHRGALASRAGRSRTVTYYTREAAHIDIAPIILKYSSQYNLDPYLVKAVIKTESCFRPLATSWCGAGGLMQLMPDTARRMGATELYDVDQNIQAGTHYLRLMLDTFGKMEYAVAAYNAGPAAVSRAHGIPHIWETEQYVVKVMSSYKAYKQGAR
ncbi:MAG: lytic transglycosylase domain-containing protein [Candidatus Xenobia bacterium]